MSNPQGQSEASAKYKWIGTRPDRPDGAGRGFRAGSDVCKSFVDGNHEPRRLGHAQVSARSCFNDAPACHCLEGFGIEEERVS